MIEFNRRTFFIDIDATIIKQEVDLAAMLANTDPVPLPGSVEKINNWYDRGARIILTTARPEDIYSRARTMRQMEQIGLKYHQLVMDCGDGIRTVINNRKRRNPTDTAEAFTLEFDEGLERINYEQD